MPKRLVEAAAALVLVLLAGQAAAEVTRLEITSKKPYGSFRAGDYVMWEGRVHGELSPQEKIPGLDKAPRNARGRVEYSSRIVLIMPGENARGNGTLLVDVPNRGKAYAEALFNSPRDEPFTSGTFEHGIGFLQDYGYSIAEVYWELGQGADLPSFTEQGRKRYVEGAGFAIMRDTADFLAHVSADKAGTPNPLKGSVSRVIASGKSQTGRFLKTFLLNGFNMAGGRRVFDGMEVFVSGSGLLPILQTGTGPESSANGSASFANPEFRGVHEEPYLTIGDIVAAVEARGEVPPKMVLISSTSDYYSIRASLGRTGASGAADRPLPPSVRMYDIAGAAHAIVPRAPKCPMPPSRLDWTPVSRAALVRLDAWIAVNAEPPASQLFPLERAGSDPPTLRAPTHLAQAVIQVPQRDGDGNAAGGVRLPDLAVPLGTHSGGNSAQEGCTLVGSWKPFARTKAEREAASDPRLSIAERYANRDDYVNRIRIAANSLIQQGLLLPEDAAVIVQAAASSRAFGPGEANPDPR